MCTNNMSDFNNNKGINFQNGCKVRVKSVEECVVHTAQTRVLRHARYLLAHLQ